MSYCRWSSDDFKSDVYAYAGCGGFEVHVAGYRYVTKLPIPPLANPITATKEEFATSWRQQSDALEKATLVPIGGKYDNQSFFYPTFEEFLDGLLDIQAHGYHVPQHAFDRIREEIKEQTKDTK